ncbi:alcohol dehydrogenase catalytic domain-containing protein, partial [Bradyrhizobium sp. 14AA]
EEVPVPQPGPGEVLVKVKACGVCHTDLHAASGDWPVKPVPPFRLHDACMSCEYCETGWETLCEHQHNTGYSVNGGFAEYVIASAA